MTYLFAAFPVPCRLTEEGHEYNGTLSVTDDGETCDHWIDAPVSYHSEVFVQFWDQQWHTTDCETGGHFHVLNLLCAGPGDVIM